MPLPVGWSGSVVLFSVHADDVVFSSTSTAQRIATLHVPYACSVKQAWSIVEGLSATTGTVASGSLLSCGSISLFPIHERNIVGYPGCFSGAYTWSGYTNGAWHEVAMTALSSVGALTHSFRDDIFTEPMYGRVLSANAPMSLYGKAETTAGNAAKRVSMYVIVDRID